MVLVLSIGALMSLTPNASGQTGTPSPDTNQSAKTQAEIDKLREETKKLETDNSLLGRLPAYGAVFAAIVALGGVYLTLRQQRADRRRDKETAIQQRNKDRDERDKERQRRFDEHFQRMVADLTSGTPAVRASAAAAIETFLKPEHEPFHEQVLRLLMANLKFPRGDLTDRIIGQAFASGIRQHKDKLRELSVAGLDLYEANLCRADLSGLDLEGCDMVRANLHGTDFTGARLCRARGLNVDLSSALLVRADLEEARLRGADLRNARLGEARLVSAKLQAARAGGASFNGASLQEANFDGADLRAATFLGANLNNAFFRTARLDEPALRSLLSGKHWETGNFDDTTHERLAALAKA